MRVHICEFPRDLFSFIYNIGTQSVQELFFLVIGVFVELFTVMIWLSFLGGCDVQQEGNWKSIICKYIVTSVMVR